MEYQQDKLRTAINEKYPYKADGISYSFDIVATYPEDNVVVVKDWNKNQYFEIPYTITDGEVTLEAPVETEHDETYTTKTVINARLAAARAEDKPVGIGWSPGVHSLFINDKPARLLVPEDTILPTYELLKDKLVEARVPLGIDHLSEDILLKNKILAKMNPLDVGEVKKVATDGRDIYITDSELTNPSVQDLQDQGELPAFSMVGPIQAHECEREDIDYVLDHFKDITRFDFVEKGGCQTCKTGIEPTELILASKLSMEVDKLTDQNNEGNNDGNNQNPTDGDGAGAAGDGNSQNSGTNNPDNNNDGVQDQDGTQTPGGDNPGQTQGADGDGSNEGSQEGEDDDLELDPKVKKYIDEQFGEIKTMIIDLGQGESQKVKAKIAEMDLKAKKAEINQKINQKISEGTVIPAMKEGLLQAGLAMKEDEFNKHIATYKKKLWDPEQHANLEAGDSGSEGKPSLKDMQNARKARRF